MKYIFTDAYKVITYDETANELDKPFILSQPEHIIKQANTIEDLCTVFVREWTYIGITFRNLYHSIAELKIDNDYIDEEEKNVKIYGAIWTDKGLLYVAKMKGILPNGEIDWELL